MKIHIIRFGYKLRSCAIVLCWNTCIIFGTIGRHCNKHKRDAQPQKCNGYITLIFEYGVKYMHFADKTYIHLHPPLYFFVSGKETLVAWQCAAGRMHVPYTQPSPPATTFVQHMASSLVFFILFFYHILLLIKKNLVVRTLTWHPSRIDCNGWAMHTCDTCDATFICANPCSAHASGLQAFFTSIIFKLMPAIFFIWCGGGGWDPWHVALLAHAPHCSCANPSATRAYQHLVDTAVVVLAICYCCVKIGVYR